MGFAVEMYFDDAADSRVRNVWRLLAERGVPPLLSEIGSQPHISLAVLESLEPNRLRPSIAEFARTTRPIDLRLSAIGTFPSSEGVVYLAPSLTPDLSACSSVP
jgi:hypothetical protein